MSRQMYGLHKAAGGFAKRERECLDGTLTCKLARCGEPSAGYVLAWNGPQPVCEGHIAGAERAGYTVVRPDPGSVGAEPEHTPSEPPAEPSGSPSWGQFDA